MRRTEFVVEWSYTLPAAELASGTLAIEHALREAGIKPDPELVAAVLAEVKRVREERAERSDFSDFQRRYYDHLNHMGLSAEEVADIARALADHRKN